MGIIEKGKPDERCQERDDMFKAIDYGNEPSRRILNGYEWGKFALVKSE